ncbi:MAG: hypothetical protein GXO32_07550 [Crenarchaeota archaeon]|nr:hypothetical protein [Thermoproteota archaeon]
MEWAIKIGVALSFAAAGFVASRFLGARRAFEYWNWFLFYGVIPLTIFLSVARAPNVPVLLALVALSAVHMFICYALSYAATRRFSDRVRITVSLLSSLPNVVFLAFPLAISLIGGVAPVVPYAIAFNSLLPLYIAYLSKRAGRGRGAKPRSYPHIAAFVAGVIANYLGVSRVVTSVLAAPAPSSVLTVLNLSSFAIIGSELAVVGSIDFSRIGLVAAFRFGVSPLVMLSMLLGLSAMTSVPRIYIVGSMLQSVMAPAVTNVILAKAFDLDTALASSSIAVLTPASIALALCVALAAGAS